MIERINPLIHRFIEPLKKFVRGPYALLAAVGLALLLGGLALREHDARLRRSFEFRHLKGETSARLKELEARAAEAVRAANQRNALVIRELEAGRKKLAAEGERLRQRLAALERDERARVERVATLPSHELAERVAARLGAGAVKDRDSGLATRDSGGGTRGSGLGARDSGLGARDSGLGRIGSSGDRAIGSSGDLVISRSDDFQAAQSPIHTITKSPDHPITKSPDHPITKSPDGLTLDTAAMRKVETAFVELEACREQWAVKDEQVANCREQLAVTDAIAARQDDSLRQLNQALRLKDEILARREELQRAELKAARGSRWERFRKAVTYVAAGIVIGVAVR